MSSRLTSPMPSMRTSSRQQHVITAGWRWINHFPSRSQWGTLRQSAKGGWVNECYFPARLPSGHHTLWYYLCNNQTTLNDIVSLQMKQEGDPASQISLVHEGLHSSMQLHTHTHTHPFRPWKPQPAMQSNLNFTHTCLRLCLLHERCTWTCTCIAGLSLHPCPICFSVCHCWKFSNALGKKIANEAELQLLNRINTGTVKDDRITYSSSN